MITFTPLTEPRPQSETSGFTLAEVMIATALSSLILAGVLSSFLMIGRTGYNAGSYSELSQETGRALDIFARDARQACDIHWNSAQSITLTLPTATNATTQVTYSYDTDAASPTYACFYRMVGAASATAARQTLVRNVAADFAFQRYKLVQDGVADNTATNDLETKQISIKMRSSRTGVTTVAANHSAISASYILRNKKVSN